MLDGICRARLAPHGPLPALCVAGSGVGDRREPTEDLTTPGSLGDLSTGSEDVSDGGDWTPRADRWWPGGVSMRMAHKSCLHSQPGLAQRETGRSAEERKAGEGRGAML